MAIKNDCGLDVSSSSNKKELLDSLYEYVCDYWDDVVGVGICINGNDILIPEEPPEDADEAIKMYFNSHPHSEEYSLKEFNL